ncbi:MAG: (d)CMP kinase [Nitrospirae bacterium]|nr:(d)CMP kinase [Nitrospirota bacterium]
MNRVIAIDGPSGAGKSTLAKALAERLGFGYLDTGALYRAVALKLRESGLTEGSGDEAISPVLSDTTVDNSHGRTYLDGTDVSDKIRSTTAGYWASVFSARPVVRQYLLNVQREVAQKQEIVAEGRDMATVVFPGAWKKFYVTADEHARARRRYDQLNAEVSASISASISADVSSSGKPEAPPSTNVTLKEALDDVSGRDARDSQRSHSPLAMAVDAYEIDTTALSVEEALQEMLKVL